MAAVAAMRIGTKEWPGLLRVEWDGEHWSFTELAKPKDIRDINWVLEKMEARPLFERTHIEMLRDLFDEDAPYPMDYDQWVAKSIMDKHVEKKLGMIVLPMSEDWLFILK